MQESKIIDGYELCRTILNVGMKRNDSTLMMVAGIVSKFVDDATEVSVQTSNKTLEDAYHKGYLDGYDAKAIEVEEDMF